MKNAANAAASVQCDLPRLQLSVGCNLALRTLTPISSTFRPSHIRSLVQSVIFLVVDDLDYRLTIDQRFRRPDCCVSPVHRPHSHQHDEKAILVSILSHKSPPG